MKFGRKEPLFDASFDEPSNGESKHLPPSFDQTRSIIRSAPSNDLNAFMGPGCIYEGKLTFEGRVRIDGRFTGEIFSTDTLEVGPQAEIEAEIDVSSVIIAGHVTGNINARGRCDLRAPGVIVGNICSPVVTMEEGVRFDGEMRMVNHVLEDAARASTQRAPAAIDLAEASQDFEESFVDASSDEGFGDGFADGEDMMGEDTFETMQEGMDRPDALAAPDPSDLLKPVPGLMWTSLMSRHWSQPPTG